VSQEWYWIDDGMTKSELVRLGQVPAPATGVQPQEVEVAITPLLQFPHDPVTPPATPIPLRRATASDPDVIATSLRVSVNAGVSTSTVADLTGVSMNDVLLIADGEQTEGVLVTQVNAGVGAGEIGFRPPLRFAHRANLNLYRRTLDGNPAPPNRLVQPANLPVSPVTDATGLVAVNVLAMIGTGSDVEFAKVMPQGGQVLNVAPELRKNHPNQTLLWRVTAVEPPLGRLQVAAKAQSNEIALTGDPSAVSDARRRNRPFLAAGDVLVIGDPLHPSPIMVQIVSVNETPAGTGGPAEEFFAIGGWVTDSTNPVAHPVSGAQVTLTDLGLTARTDAEGRFTFANVPRGENYRLDVTADGFMPKLNLVKVPAPDAIGTAHGLNEYRVTLNT
jgi:hypothetical protein